MLTKILSNRLSSILPKLISKEQHAFVKGRQIGDCVSITQELVQDINRKVRRGNIILKLDMMKAHDHMEWDFLLRVLSCFGFSSQFVNLISNCLHSQHFSVNVNGSLCGFFKASRGLRQGDPISPSLFILAEEVLNRGLKFFFYRGLVNFFNASRSSMKITHLLFTDDTLIFLNSGKKSLVNLLCFIQRYELASGKKVNKQKSSIFVSSKMPHSHSFLLSTMSSMVVKDSSFSFSYLGCPIFKGRVKCSYFANIVQIFRSRLEGWYAKLFLNIGRVILTKHVLNAIPTHVLACTTTPKTVLSKLNSIMAKFLWCDKDFDKRRFWVSWDLIAL